MYAGARNRRQQMDTSSLDLSTIVQQFELYNRTEGKSPKLSVGTTCL